MRKIITDITINAPINTIWDILMDFDNYEKWNPFVQSISGQAEIGEKINVKLGLGNKPMAFEPKIMDVQPNRRFAWKGKLFLPKLFDGHHVFELQKINEETTQFKHYEEFTGILVWPILKMIGEKTKKGFEAMNRALKEQAELTPLIDNAQH